MKYLKHTAPSSGECGCILALAATLVALVAATALVCNRAGLFR